MENQIVEGSRTWECEILGEMEHNQICDQEADGKTFSSNTHGYGVPVENKTSVTSAPWGMAKFRKQSKRFADLDWDRE